MCLLAICMTSLEKCLIRFLAHFLTGFELFLVARHGLVWVTCVFWILTCSWSQQLQIFSPISEAGFFIFSVTFAYFCFYFFCLRRLPQENIAMIYVRKCSAFVSSRNFMVWSLLFRFLKHFVFIFVYGVKECSKLIVWHIAVQFSRDCCWRDCLFLVVYTLSWINWSYVYGFISGLSLLFHWSLCLFLCQHHSVLITVHIAVFLLIKTIHEKSSLVDLLHSFWWQYENIWIFLFLKEPLTSKWLII